MQMLRVMCANAVLQLQRVQEMEMQQQRASEGDRQIDRQTVGRAVIQAVRQAAWLHAST